MNQVLMCLIAIYLTIGVPCGMFVGCRLFLADTRTELGCLHIVVRLMMAFAAFMFGLFFWPIAVPVARSL